MNQHDRLSEQYLDTLIQNMRPEIRDQIRNSIRAAEDARANEQSESEARAFIAMTIWYAVIVVGLAVFFDLLPV